jgi:hypothetical protein
MDRWFEVSIVVERTPSSEMWSDTVVELERLLQYAGVFRDVRVHWLDLSGEPVVMQRSGEHAPPQTLSDPSGGRMIFFFSAGVSGAWADGRLGAVLASWSRTMPVVLVHALPERMWPDTLLGRPPVVVDTVAVGTPNDTLQSRAAWWARRLPLDLTRLPLPVLALEPASARRWAEMIACRRGTSAPAFLVDRVVRASSDRDGSAYGTIVDPERRVRHLALAAPPAYRLAVMLAPSPFSLPLARLVHAALYGRGSETSAVAEVMLSGLVERVPSLPGAREAVFRFEKTAREVLLQGLRRDDARDLSDLLERHLADTAGVQPEGQAYVIDPGGANIIAADTTPFAELRDSLAQRLGIKPPDAVRPPRPRTVIRAIDGFIKVDKPLIGRDKDVATVVSALRKRPVVLVVGPTGVGKTSVARTVANAVSDRYDVVWRLDAGSAAGLTSTARTLRQTLGLPVENQPRERVALIQQLLRDVAATPSRVLLIADDVPATVVQRVKWTPSARDTVDVLITARQWRSLYGNVLIHRLKSLTPQDGNAYLRSESRRSEFSASVAAWLVQRIGTLPATLTFAATALREGRVSIRTYASNVSRRGKNGRDGIRDRALTGTLLTLIDMAEEDEPGASGILVTLCFLGDDVLPLSLLEQPAELYSASHQLLRNEVRSPRDVVQDREGLLRTVAALQRFALVSTASPGVLLVPRLVAEVVRHVLRDVGADWFETGAHVIFKALTKASADGERNALIAAAAFVLDDSRRFPDPGGRSVTSAALAIEFAFTALKRSDHATANDFRFHAGRLLDRSAGSPEAARVWQRLVELHRACGDESAAEVALARLEQATAGKPLRDSGFVSKVQLLELARRWLRTDGAIGELLLFTTDRQQTWLFFGRGRVVCFLHGRGRSAGADVAQWSMKSEEIVPVVARPHSTTTGLLDIGNRTRWLYSLRLHPNAVVLEQQIYHLAKVEPPKETGPVPERMPVMASTARKKSTTAVTPGALKKSPPKKSSAKRSAAKKPAAKKSSAKKSSAKRSATKKSPAKKSLAKKSLAKKSSAKKTSAKKTSAKKTSAKKSSARKSTTRKPSRKKKPSAMKRKK